MLWGSLAQYQRPSQPFCLYICWAGRGGAGPRGRRMSVEADYMRDCLEVSECDCFLFVSALVKMLSGETCKCIVKIAHRGKACV